MTGSELLICYSASGTFSVSECSQLYSILIQSVGDKPSVTATKGSRQPVWEESTWCGPLVFQHQPPKVNLQTSSRHCHLQLFKSSHPPWRTSPLFLIPLAVVPRATGWGVPEPSPDCPGHPHFLQCSNLPCEYTNWFHTPDRLGFEFVRKVGEGNKSLWRLSILISKM